MRLIRPLVLGAASLALLAPGAHAAGFDNVYDDYKKDGRIDPCRWSPSDLERAKDDVPPDIEQYAPDFPDALDVAIEARAKGSCAKKKPSNDAAAPGAPPATPPPAAGGGSAAPAPAPAPAATPANVPAPTATAAPAGAPQDGAIASAAATTRGDAGASDAPAPLVGLAVLAALLVLALLGWGLARWRAWEPAWALRARHAAGEAGWRAGNTWSEFADWARLGR